MPIIKNYLENMAVYGLARILTFALYNFGSPARNPSQVLALSNVMFLNSALLHVTVLILREQKVYPILLSVSF